MNELQTYDNTVEITNIQLDKAIQNFLERRSYENYNVQKVDIETNEDIDFVKISHISYDRSKSDTDLNLIDFQQLLSAVASKSKKFVYMIESSINGIDLYIGTAKESNSSNFSKDTFEGIYSGSTVSGGEDSQPSFSEDMKYSKAMLGIPALKRDSDKEYKQSLEKILFPMQGKKFRIVLIAESYDLNTIQDIISNYQTLGSEMHRLVKKSKNKQYSNADSEGITISSSSSMGISNGKSNSGRDNMTERGERGAEIADSIKLEDSEYRDELNKGKNFLGRALGQVFGFGEAIFYGKSNTETRTNTRTNTDTNSQIKNHTKTSTIGITFDEINKSAEYCENLIDAYIERFQKGLNHGMWNSSLYIQAEDGTVLSELEHTLKSVYSGDESYYETIRFSDDLKDIDIAKLPMLFFDKNNKLPTIHPSFTGFSSAINTEELSILAALPNNDLDGLSVSKISSFGLSQAQNVNNTKSIEVGVVLNKKKPTHQRFRLSTEALNSHLFVSGITGSGKSNTIKSILTSVWEKYDIPFLVIEPAKSEYQLLQKAIPDLQIFRPGSAGDIFRFNPFVFEYKKNGHYNVLNHIDSIKSSFSAAFPMYGPMPYILEEAIQKVYEDKGWSLLTLEHSAFDETEGMKNEFNRMLFPDMKDLLKAIANIVDNAGYHDELQNNIKAALVTRIKNLTIGAKGFIFNSQHAISNEHLFDKPTIIELSSIVNGEEKSFIMGLILNSLYRYRESFGISDHLRHLVVIEEAHRLLPNVSLDQNMESANSKASSVEMFTNMLAEVRSFGEGIIIADQVANKLHTDVIKNTNVKILHRTMAKDDRTVVGESINLDDNQILDIAELGTGEAIVHSKEVHQAFLVKIDKAMKDNDHPVRISDFQKKFLDDNSYYRYEFPFESKFYDEGGVKIISENREVLFTSKNQNLILQTITQTMLGEKEKTKYYWQLFASSISDIVESKRQIIYCAMALFLNFEPFSDISIYKKQFYFKKMHEAIVNLFIALIDKVELDQEIEKLQKSLMHKKLKNTFASMEFYHQDHVDFSVLLNEQFTYNNETRKYMNEVLPVASSDKNELLIALDQLSQMVFGQQSYSLRYVLLAMRYGDREKNINNLLEELNND